MLEPEPCHLMSLPPELRLHVYEHVLSQSDGLPRFTTLAVVDEVYLEERAAYAADLARLTRTCREICNEAMPILLHQCNVDFFVEDGDDRMSYGDGSPSLGRLDEGRLMDEMTLRNLRHAKVCIFPLDISASETLCERIRQVVVWLLRSHDLKTITVLVRPFMLNFDVDFMAFGKAMAALKGMQRRPTITVDPEGLEFQRLGLEVLAKMLDE
ncbi:hypothetical protein B0A50_00997 [Salinomyces thailandicus]|uniref:F-box domain-containing protein n=1 Tax=Salinomyces thailandicus TaxID=706561 RepID=A0A4U0UDC4_9PEZI|nr:hypothetical protein B0A50_00997 [Salinomyces thailandica]